VLSDLVAVIFLVVGVCWVAFALPLARVGASLYFSTTDMELRQGKRYRVIQGAVVAGCVGNAVFGCVAAYAGARLLFG
jgi:hypothetical protein